MKYNVICKKVELSDARKEKLIDKVKKLDKFFDSDLECKILIAEQKNDIIMEITFVHKGFVFRAEAQNKDLIAATDDCLAKLDRQIRKNKTKLAKHLRQPFIGEYDTVVESPEAIAEESEFNIIKKKKIDSKPMTAEEAILQMNMLGHDFFIFRQADTMKITIVYKRKDGNYGLLETE
ncbi:MAG: ribosome-associated translation inhibitor RaiA [Clostridia bacterium]|nr:ribosome-associated translation inhibitor RaiA [Clostridia bacterium]